MFSLEKTITKIMLHYHANAIDLNRTLYVMGLRNDEKTERVAMKHTMATIGTVARTLGKSEEEVLEDYYKKKH